MQGKKPTYQERKILEANGYDPMEWLIQKNAVDFIQIVNRETKEEKVIQK